MRVLSSQKKGNSQYLILKMDACGLLCNCAKKDALQAVIAIGFQIAGVEVPAIGGCPQVRTVSATTQGTS
jgi:hypothetical protein